MLYPVEEFLAANNEGKFGVRVGMVKLVAVPDSRHASGCVLALRRSRPAHLVVKGSGPSSRQTLSRRVEWPPGEGRKALTNFSPDGGFPCVVTNSHLIPLRSLVN
jgi:hypothetical protein